MNWNDHLTDPTREQLDFVETLRSRLHLSHTELDRLCVGLFGTSMCHMTKRQVSQLLDQMQAWKQVPADLQREMGQLDLLEGMG